jgi:hypothetical protein
MEPRKDAKQPTGEFASYGERRQKSRFTATYVLLAVAFLSMLCINFYSYITVVNISDKYSKLNNAAMSFKLKVLNANLLFRR